MSDDSLGKIVRREIDALIVTLVEAGIITMEDYKRTREKYLKHLEGEE